jgi:hypothetical protein
MTRRSLTPLLWFVVFHLLLTGNVSTVYGEESSRPPLETLLATFAHEPDVRSVQQAALRYGELGGRRLDRYSARARASNLLPRIQGQWGWLDQRDSQLRYRENLKTGADGIMYRDVAQNHLNEDLRLRSLYTVRVSFDLGGLVYDPAEPAIAREVRSRLSHREELLQRVTHLYFERRHRQLLLAAEPHASWQARLERTLEIDRLTAQLDALTGGWFRQSLEQRQSDQAGGNR